VRNGPEFNCPAALGFQLTLYDNSVMKTSHMSSDASRVSCSELDGLGWGMK